MLEEEVVQSDNITSVEYLKRLKPHVVKDQRVQCCECQIKCQKRIYLYFIVCFSGLCVFADCHFGFRRAGGVVPAPEL